MKTRLRDLLHDAECLATDLRNAAEGYGVGNLRTKANLAKHIEKEVEHLWRCVPDLLASLQALLPFVEMGFQHEGDVFGVHHNDATDALSAAENLLKQFAS